MKKLICALSAVIGMGQVGCSSLNLENLKTSKSYSFCQADPNNLRAMVKSEAECTKFIKMVGAVDGGFCKGQDCQVIDMRNEMVAKVSQ